MVLTKLGRKMERGQKRMAVDLGTMECVQNMCDFSRTAVSVEERVSWLSSQVDDVNEVLLRTQEQLAAMRVSWDAMAEKEKKTNALWRKVKIGNVRCERKDEVEIIVALIQMVVRSAKKIAPPCLGPWAWSTIRRSKLVCLKNIE